MGGANPPGLVGVGADGSGLGVGAGSGVDPPGIVVGDGVGDGVGGLVRGAGPGLAGFDVFLPGPGFLFLPPPTGAFPCAAGSWLAILRARRL